MSLLERNDLRTNVVVLSTNLSGKDSNLFEYLSKSDGTLLSLSYANDDMHTLVAVEQFESTQTGQFSIEVYKHSIYEETGASGGEKSRPKQKLASFSLSSRVMSGEQVKASKR